MTFLKINADDFLLFSKVARGLPGIKPMVTRGLLKEAALQMVHDAVDHLDLSGSSVTQDELNELFHETARTGYVTEVVSPAGARLLIRLYLAGALPMKAKQAPTAPTSELQAYCDSELELEAKQEARRARHLAYEEKLSNPQCISEAEFTWPLLNAVFWRHGKELREMVIGGITVHKLVQRFASNSRKDHDFKISFSWNSANGRPHEIKGFSKYEGNRANDEKRNWGLYE